MKEKRWHYLINDGPGTPSGSVTDYEYIMLKLSLMDRTNVETVIVAGKVRNWKGKLLDVDLRRLREQLENSRDYVFAKAGIPRSCSRSHWNARGGIRDAAVSCVDGPRLARDLLTRCTEIACSHVSGLLMQSESTAGPDGFREPSPHHSNGIDAPMKRQVCLGCVGSTDCAITRHCSLASSSARLGSLSCQGHALVILLPVHHRPGDACRLVRQRHRHDHAWPPPSAGRSPMDRHWSPSSVADWRWRR